MGKTKTARITVNMTPAMKALVNMKNRDIQLACILRGMPPKDMVEADHHDLVVYFTQNFEKGEDLTLLPLHWAWVDEQLAARGHTKDSIIRSPLLRLGYTGDVENMEKPKVFKSELIPKDETKKPKAEMDAELGVRKGTKKALTYELTKKKVALDKIIEAVLKTFPDAQEKSIKIWYKRALNTK